MPLELKTISQGDGECQDREYSKGKNAALIQGPKIRRKEEMEQSPKWEYKFKLQTMSPRTRKKSLLDSAWAGKGIPKKFEMIKLNSFKTGLDDLSSSNERNRDKINRGTEGTDRRSVPGTEVRANWSPVWYPKISTWPGTQKVITSVVVRGLNKIRVHSMDDRPQNLVLSWDKKS